VLIQQATLADVDAVAKVAAATFALACPPGTTEENIRSFIATNLSPEVFAHYLSSPDHRVWLAWQDDEPIEDEPAGYALSIHEDPADEVIKASIQSSPTVELSKIYVREGHHGGGVAQALLDAVVEEAKAAQAVSVWLGVNQHNHRANRFYEKNGFVNKGIRLFQVGDSLEEDFVREKMLG
jgi:ribosomal protein S18 acetylase RimI-like enzyme